MTVKEESIIISYPFFICTAEYSKSNLISHFEDIKRVQLNFSNGNIVLPKNNELTQFYSESISINQFIGKLTPPIQPLSGAQKTIKIKYIPYYLTYLICITFGIFHKDINAIKEYNFSKECILIKTYSSGTKSNKHTKFEFKCGSEDYTLRNMGNLHIKNKYFLNIKYGVLANPITSKASIIE